MATEGPEKEVHPALARFRKLDSEGRAAAFTIEEQWELSASWLAFVESELVDEYPMISSLKNAWEELGSEGVERGQELRNVSDSPLSVLFYFIEMGMYPPPELLLALADSWSIYGANAGAMSLEEAFLGPSKKGAGNYAGRRHSKYRKRQIAWDFSRLLAKGMTRTEAAEAISLEMGGKPDVDSILRSLRGFGGFDRKSGKAEK